jgi:hypothetical protein
MLNTAVPAADIILLPSKHADQQRTLAVELVRDPPHLGVAPSVLVSVFTLALQARRAARGMDVLGERGDAVQLLDRRAGGGIGQRRRRVVERVLDLREEVWGAGLRKRGAARRERAYRGWTRRTCGRRPSICAWTCF